MIAPKIARRAQGKDAVGLLREFYPECTVTRSSSAKELRRDMRKALASFHPDRSRSKSLEEQIKAEEIFKVLSHANQQLSK